MNKKASDTAKIWMRPALMFAVFDCSDSMHDAEKLEERFNAYVDDSIPIEKFIKENLYDEYLKECLYVAKYEGDEGLESLEDTPSTLPIPFEEIKEDLEKLLNE